MDDLGAFFTPSHGCCIWFDSAKLRHGTEPVRSPPGSCQRVGCALTLKKGVLTHAENMRRRLIEQQVVEKARRIAAKAAGRAATRRSVAVLLAVSHCDHYSAS